MHELELYHHGILGQKWGVRRFQNADGTRTDAGKKRYSDEERAAIKAERKAARAEKREAKQQIKRDYKEAKSLNRGIGDALTKMYQVNEKHDLNADRRLYDDAVNKASEFVKSHPQYELTSGHTYYLDGGELGGVTAWIEASGMGIDTVKGTDAYRYGRRRSNIALAAVGGATIAYAAAMVKLANS